MKTLKEKLLALLNAKEIYIAQQYQNLAKINIWEEYNQMWYEIDEIVEHILEWLLKNWAIQEYRRMREELNIKDRIEIEEDKDLSYKLITNQ